MSTIAYSARALRDLDRIAQFWLPNGKPIVTRVLNVIIDAIEVLKRHPFVGRCVRGEIRELVISRGRTGYVALYRVTQDDEIQILTLRHQREAGFA
jgi:plasmid stabilization system protein ParE